MGSRRSRKYRRSRDKAQVPSAEAVSVPQTVRETPDSQAKSANIWITLLLIAATWLFAFLLREHWVDLALKNPAFVTAEGDLLPTTNDSYYFAAIIENWNSGNLKNIVLMPDIYQHGMITMMPALLMKCFGWSASQIMIHMPMYVSGLLAVPLVLIGRLYGSLSWGFAAAMLSVAAHSYFNRTIAGYFDTDMYSLLIPMFALYFMLAAYHRQSLGAALGATLCLFLYPLFYQSGIPIAFALGTAFVGYSFLADAVRLGRKIFSSFSLQPLMDHWRNHQFTWQASLLVILAMLFLESSLGHRVAAHPILWFGKLGCLIGLFFGIRIRPPSFRLITATTGVVAILFLFLIAPLGTVISKTHQYLPQAQIQAAARQKQKPVAGELKFKNVVETVQEAQKQESPWRNRGIICRRIIGSMTVCLLAAIGYLALVIRRPEFLMALPLVGIGVYSLWGGYRFTMYAGPIAGLALTHGFFLAFKKPWDHMIRVGLGLAVLGGLAWGGWAVDLAGLSLTESPKFDFNASTKIYSLVQAKGYELESGLHKLLPLPVLFGLTLGAMAWLAPVRRTSESVLVMAGVVLLATLLARFMMFDVAHRWLVEVTDFHDSPPNWTWGLGFLTMGIITFAIVLSEFWVRSGIAETPRELKQSGHLWRSAAAIVLGLGATWFLLKPNYQWTLEYNKTMSQRPPVLEKGSVMALEKLREKSRPGDYVLTWWDWGTAVWHHAGRNVICHPGHQSDDTFVVAKMLSSTSSLQAANLARRAVEDFAKNPPASTGHNVIKGILTQNNFGGPDAVLNSMASPEYKPPSPPLGGRNIYLFLPGNLLQILPVIRKFSERDLTTGDPRPTGLYLPLQQVSLASGSDGATRVTVKHNQQPTYEIIPNEGMIIYVKSLSPNEFFKTLSAQPRPTDDLSEADRFYRFEMALRRNQLPLGEWWPYQTCALFLKGQTTGPLVGRLAEISGGNFRFQPIRGGKAISVPLTEVQRVHPVFLLNTSDIILISNKGKEHQRDQKHFRSPKAGFQNSNLHITLSTEFGTCMVVDHSVYFSNLYQMLVLGAYDPRVFEPMSVPIMYDRGQMNVTRIYKLLR